MNSIRVSFLIAIDVLVIATLGSLLSGCVAATQKGRNGDFVSNMASTEVGIRATGPADAHAATPAASFTAQRA